MFILFYILKHNPRATLQYFASGFKMKSYICIKTFIHSHLSFLLWSNQLYFDHDGYNRKPLAIQKFI